LYAAGALVGVYHRRYPAATSVLRGATFGRIAGANAAKASKAQAGGPDAPGLETRIAAVSGR